MTIDRNRAGLSLGLLSGLMHLLWVLIVGAGMGQSMMSWWSGMHFMMNTGYSVGSFAFGNGLLGVVMALIWGYVIGWVFAAIWNAVGKK